MTLLQKKQARADQVKSELDALRTLLDVAPDDKVEGHYQRAQALTAELRSLNADIADLQAEAFDPNDPDGRTAVVMRGRPATSHKRSSEDEAADTGSAPDVVLAGARSQQTAQLADKLIFRHGEKLADKYESRGIDVDKVLRAAITGNRDILNDAERRAITPTTGGAMLAPEVSSLVIDNMRQSNWMAALQPTIIPVSSSEMQIPNITGLPAAIMHEPGTQQNFSEPIITGVILAPKTMIVLCMVTNELLRDSGIAQGAISGAIVSAAANKLLQQVMYGTGIAPEMKGVTLYDPSGFAAAGDKSAEKDLFNLATLANTAIIKRNGTMDAMLYDPDLEPRLNKRLATGELVEPSRAFQRLYDAGRTLAHPSMAAGDMLFMRSGALYIGMRQEMQIEVDPSRGFDSNSTAIRLTMRADIFADTAHMAYYSDIPAVEPA